MSYVDAVYVKDKDLINVVERVDGVRKFKSFPAHYLFYYQDNKGQYTGIDGKRLTKVAVATNKAFDKEKRIYSHKQLYESDSFKDAADSAEKQQIKLLLISFIDVTKIVQ